MTHPADALEQVFRLARLNRPDQARRKASDHLRAFLVQHQALAVAISHEINRATACGCEDCCNQLPSMLEGLVGIEADLRSLFIAGDILEDVSANFDMPEREHFDIAEEVLRERMIAATAGDDTDEARDTLEHILSLPDTDAPS